MAWNERDGVRGRGSYGVGIAESVLRGKGVRNEKITTASLLFGGPFFGTNPLDGAHPALNEWFGLYVSTQDHAQAGQRTLADFRLPISLA